MREDTTLVRASGVVLVALLLPGCGAVDRTSLPEELPNFVLEDLEPSYEREDVAGGSVPVFGYVLDDSTHARATQGTVGINSFGAGGVIDAEGRFFFLAPPGRHMVSAFVLGYRRDSVEVVVDSDPVRVDLRLRSVGISLH